MTGHAWVLVSANCCISTLWIVRVRFKAEMSAAEHSRHSRKVYYYYEYTWNWTSANALSSSSVCWSVQRKRCRIRKSCCTHTRVFQMGKVVGRGFVLRKTTCFFLQEEPGLHEKLSEDRFWMCPSFLVVIFVLKNSANLTLKGKDINVTHCHKNEPLWK